MTTLGVTSAQCMAHARRKFNDLWAHHGSEVGRKALRHHQVLLRIEREIEDLPADERRRIRQRKSRRVLAVFQRWLLAQRQRVPSGSATMKAIDDSLKRWKQLTLDPAVDRSLPRHVLAVLDQSGPEGPHLSGEHAAHPIEPPSTALAALPILAMARAIAAVGAWPARPTPARSGAPICRI